MNSLGPIVAPDLLPALVSASDDRAGLRFMGDMPPISAARTRGGLTCVPWRSLWRGVRMPACIQSARRFRNATTNGQGQQRVMLDYTGRHSRLGTRLSPISPWNLDGCPVDFRCAKLTPNRVIPRTLDGQH